MTCVCRGKAADRRTVSIYHKKGDSLTHERQTKVREGLTGGGLLLLGAATGCRDTQNIQNKKSHLPLVLTATE